MNLSQGVILVSFGSAVKPSQMTKERRAIFLEVFSQLGVMYGDGAEAQPKQEERYFLSIFVSNVFFSEEYTIIWKWDEEEVEGLPPNVVLSKWLPQQVFLVLFLFSLSNDVFKCK